MDYLSFIFGFFISMLTFCAGYLIGCLRERKVANRVINKVAVDRDKIALKVREMDDLLDMADDLDCHPDGYEGPCCCKECQSYSQ